MFLNNTFIFSERLLGKYLRKGQGIYTYRKVARFFSAQIKIKEANEEDLIRIRKLFHRDVDNAARKSFQVTDFLATNKKNAMVGFVQLVRYPARPGPYAGYWLFSLSVKFFYRRMGIGQRLAQAVIEKAKAEGAEEVSLLVFEDSREAIKLYSKLGFKFKVIPALEEQLEKERARYNYRRVVMSKLLKN